MNKQISSIRLIRLFRYLTVLCFFNFQNVILSDEFVVDNENASNKSKIFYPEKPNLNGNEYILSGGDLINIDFAGIKAYSGQYYVDPDGNLFLPDIGIYNVEGKTLNELRKELLNSYRDFIFEPEITLQIQSYRPVNVYLRGEVRSPGLYRVEYEIVKKSNTTFNSTNDFTSNNSFSSNSPFSLNSPLSNDNLKSYQLPPTLFDVLTQAKGFTKSADLSEIKIIRNNTISQGGGKISAKINLLSLLLEGDQSVNIRIFDGDTIVVPKSENLLKDQILEIQRSNLSPEFISVFITGNVRKGGEISLKKGASLNHAIASTGGKKILTGNIEFIRFKYDGETDKSLFRYDSNAPIASKRNPILMDGDIINVRRTPIGAATEILGEISSPVLSGYGLYNIFN
ncbi:Periplasmic protein involved in polysaccharide export [Prochlorococcus marinus str. MIT 9321]|uniref:Periplasmic protein involved in polysaccharide export n=1 Tax=Prochlorococcus marinus str. MIT 9401 TaxID=167551 RepID=A0A0A2BCX4_PROMR|nr:polysaccharide biosynthesis/export family protein [Prochlorococcus marinus]KGG02822.1 Periplasmic protein involved in polysaccharide export [Prochlorococcus marinus str. MIT 9321]KGG05455.1 Periplasmic protein involved in polysaccharide export [Prochlorococcus marinus str. MIT 9322]KGG10489.1 Periplasmic protein involved in polysaccharide export [Prochlorococcus marinus str. MIT 9401]